MKHYLVILSILALMISSCANGITSRQDAVADQQRANEALVQALQDGQPEEGEPEEEPRTDVPKAEEYAPLAVQHGYQPLEQPKMLAPMSEQKIELKKTKLLTLKRLDYYEILPVPTEEQWVTLLFNLGGAVHGGHQNVYFWPGSLLAFEMGSKTFIVGTRHHDLTVTMDLKLHSKDDPESVTFTKHDEGKLEIKIKDWNPENPTFWIAQGAGEELAVHDGVMKAPIKGRHIYVQKTGDRLDCRLAVMLVQNNSEGKLVVRGGVFSFEIEDGEKAFPSD